MILMQSNPICEPGVSNAKQLRNMDDCLFSSLSMNTSLALDVLANKNQKLYNRRTDTLPGVKFESAACRSDFGG